MNYVVFAMCALSIHHRIITQEKNYLFPNLRFRYHFEEIFLVAIKHFTLCPLFVYFLKFTRDLSSHIPRLVWSHTSILNQDSFQTEILAIFCCCICSRFYMQKRQIVNHNTKHNHSTALASETATETPYILIYICMLPCACQRGERGEWKGGFSPSSFNTSS